MPAYNFQKRFVTKIVTGEKCQTIRKPRKYPTKPGHMIYMYTGLRTKNAVMIARSPCIEVTPMMIFPEWKKITNLLTDKPCSFVEIFQIALDDGFDDIGSFFGFFTTAYKENILTMEIIKWNRNLLEVNYVEEQR